MMTSAERETGWSRRRRAVHYRDGLMIALLAYRPLRLTNFASIVLGVHLVQQSGGWWLQFPASGMKAKRPYEVAFPTALVPELEHYLAVHRNVLLAGESGQLSPGTDALWVSEVGTMLESGALARRIRKHTKEAFGASLPPHWFRDAAATSIAIENPRHVCDAHHILGNTLAMTEKHYNQARSLEASRRHQRHARGSSQLLEWPTTGDPMMRAAIYARFSSENQSVSSITDQIEVCSRYIAKNSWTAVTTYSDAAMSGASRFRPGYQQLLADLDRGLFDVSRGRSARSAWTQARRCRRSP